MLDCNGKGAKHLHLGLLKRVKKGRKEKGAKMRAFSRYLSNTDKTLLLKVSDAFKIKRVLLAAERCQDCCFCCLSAQLSGGISVSGGGSAWILNVIFLIYFMQKCF